MSASKPMFLRFGRLSAYHAADDVVFLLESEVMPYIEQLRAELERVKTVYHDLVETAFSLSDETAAPPRTPDCPHGFNAYCPECGDLLRRPESEEASHD